MVTKTATCADSLRQAAAAIAEQAHRTAFNELLRQGAKLDPEGTLGETVSAYLEAMGHELSLLKKRKP